MSTRPTSASYARTIRAKPRHALRVGAMGGVGGAVGLLINGFLALALGALLAQAIACDPGPHAAPTDDMLDSAASARPMLPSATPTSAKLPTPTVMPRMHTHGPPPFSFAPVPLEQRIYFAPTIVRASLLNGEPTVESVPIGQGVAPIYKAAHIFRFSVVEYLRGDGPSEVTVRAQSNDSFVSEEEAWEIAKRSFEGRNASWDDREAVLFLVGQSDAGVAGASGQQTQLFQFPDWAWGEFQYTIDTLNKVWLPSAQAPGVSGQSGDGGSRSYLTGYGVDRAGGAAGSGGTSSSISLAELRAQITAANADLLAGREGYEECLYRKFAREQDLQAEAMYAVDNGTDALYTIPGVPSSAPTRTLAASYLPSEGDLYYNGGVFADAFLKWGRPQWTHTDRCHEAITRCSTYEHDLTVDLSWFMSLTPRTTLLLRIAKQRRTGYCTTWSNLPYWYDDCPTAGIPSSYSGGSTDDIAEMSFGTFRANAIATNRYYYGSWTIRGHQAGASNSATVRLHGQEGYYYTRVPFRNVGCTTIWCIDGINQGDGTLLTTTWTRGVANYKGFRRLR